MMRKTWCGFLPGRICPIAQGIFPLGDWVMLSQAFLAYIAKSGKAKVSTSSRPSAVNCSAAQLKESIFLPKILAIIEQYNELIQVF